MSSFVDTVKDLLDLKTDFKLSLNLQIPVSYELKEVAEKLQQQANGNVNMPTAVDIRKLSAKITNTYKRTGKIGNLTYRESKNLPFLLNSISDHKLIDHIINKIKSNTSIAMLKREIYVYFINFSETDYSTSKLGKDIVSKLTAFTGRSNFLQTLKRNMYIFNPVLKTRILQNCIKQGFFEFFRGLNFNKTLLASNYTRNILEQLYRDETKEFSFNQQRELFNKIYSEENWRKIYTSVLPVILGRLIIEVDTCNRSDKNHLKEKLRPLVLRELGEPRIQHTNNSRWLIAGETAKRIFIRWISQFDLDLFFRIIKDSIPDYEYEQHRMWLFREKFWKSYRSNISMVWVCFGDAAIRRVRNEKISYGRFLASDPYKSCIIMEIGSFIFVERSYNGKAKVWNRDKCPFPIGCVYVDENALIAAKSFNEWVHTYNSRTDNKTWQNNIGDFIWKNCRIPKQTELW